MVAWDVPNLDEVGRQTHSPPQSGLIKGLATHQTKKPGSEKEGVGCDGRKLCGLEKGGGVWQAWWNRC